jgi:hypothetical protein
MKNGLFLTWATEVDELSASRPGRFTPCEIVLGTHLTGGCLGPELL